MSFSAVWATFWTICAIAALNNALRSIPGWPEGGMPYFPERPHDAVLLALFLAGGSVGVALMLVAYLFLRLLLPVTVVNMLDYVWGIPPGGIPPDEQLGGRSDSLATTSGRRRGGLGDSSPSSERSIITHDHPAADPIDPAGRGSSGRRRKGSRRRTTASAT